MVTLFPIKPIHTKLSSIENDLLGKSKEEISKR